MYEKRRCGSEMIDLINSIYIYIYIYFVFLRNAIFSNNAKFSRANSTGRSSLYMERYTYVCVSSQATSLADVSVFTFLAGFLMKLWFTIVPGRKFSGRSRYSRCLSLCNHAWNLLLRMARWWYSRCLGYVDSNGQSHKIRMNFLMNVHITFAS